MTALLVGYDGSPSAAGAIEVGALLLPGASSWIAHVWKPSLAGPELRGRLFRRVGRLSELQGLVEQESRAEAERTVATGATLARAAGWEAEPLVERSWGDDGFTLADLADRFRADAVVVGSRGLSGARALLGSVSDSLVHYSPAPVLVIPQALLQDERSAAASGPVLIGHDGSAGARRALATAATLFAGRPLIAAHAGDEPPADDELAGAEPMTVAPRGVASSARAVADGLAAAADERGAGVIVVGSRGRSAAREALLGSVAMATLHHPHRPVLVVPDAERFSST